MAKKGARAAALQTRPLCRRRIVPLSGKTECGQGKSENASVIEGGLYSFDSITRITAFYRLQRNTIHIHSAGATATDLYIIRPNCQEQTQRREFSTLLSERFTETRN